MSEQLLLSGFMAWAMQDTAWFVGNCTKLLVLVCPCRMSISVLEMQVIPSAVCDFCLVVIDARLRGPGAERFFHSEWKI